MQRMLRALALGLLSASCSSLPPSGTPVLVEDGAAPDSSVTPDRPVAVDVPVGFDAGRAPDVVTPAQDLGPGVDVIAAQDVVTPPRDVPAAPRDAVTAVDVVTVTDRGASVDAGPVAEVPLTDALRQSLPVLDTATVARVRELRALGNSRGMRANVFAKIGDSITESGSFLSDIGEGWFELGTFRTLEPTITFFRAQSIGGNNSFNRASTCATAGWTAARALENDPSSPLRGELAATRPAYAVVMYGTNDIDQATPDALQANLTRIAEIIEANGTVPILSTIPDRTDRSAAGALALTMNQRIRAVAAARRIPLMDYWAALQPLPARGMDGDGIHPNVYRNNGDAQAGDFTTAGVRFGYNMRNLVAILALDRVRAIQ
jgi:GDSL-like Lipase/Acylhydrolase family